MNWDTIAGKWTEYKGKIKSQWGELTDDDLARINGKRDVLVGLVQQRYGKMKDVAEKEVEEFLRASDETTRFKGEEPNRPSDEDSSRSKPREKSAR
ncbi:MAG: CsbD family protein [Myxococcaceae bacterium]